MNDKPIGIFDSGIGGLTVVRQVSKLLPTERLIYFGDTARVPYGSKSPQVVREFALQDGMFLYDKNVKALIVACNTVSAEALALLQEELDIPVIGVIKPGAAAAASATQNGRIGVIGTHGTIASGAYATELLATDSSINVESNWRRRLFLKEKNRLISQTRLLSRQESRKQRWMAALQTVDHDQETNEREELSPCP